MKWNKNEKLSHCQWPMTVGRRHQTKATYPPAEDIRQSLISYSSSLTMPNLRNYSQFLLIFLLNFGNFLSHKPSKTKYFTNNPTFTRKRRFPLFAVAATAMSAASTTTAMKNISIFSLSIGMEWLADTFYDFSVSIDLPVRRASAHTQFFGQWKKNQQQRLGRKVKPS